MNSDPIQASVVHVILLVPGIRDFGGWTNKAQSLLEANTSCRAFRVGLDYYDALRFLSPRDSSQQPYEKLVSQYEAVLSQYPNATVSIIAHSFGTFLVGRLLREYRCDRLGRVVLCGSVLPRDYDWDDVRHKLRGPDCVLNECGYSDGWPVTAGLLRKRYGPGGVYGFDQIYPQSRWFNGGHSLFFRTPHMAAWQAFIFSGVLPKSNATMPEPSFFVRLCKTVPGTSDLLGFVLTVIWLFLWRLYWIVGIILLGLAFWFLFPHAKPIDAHTFINEWRVNSTQQMHHDYVLTKMQMTGECEINPDVPIGTEFHLKWPGSQGEDGRFGDLSVTPSTPIGAKSYPPGSKLKFSGRIESITDYLGVHVTNAETEVVQPH